MHAPTAISAASEHVAAPSVLPEELEFYQSYDWCLNPYFTVSEAAAHLREEIDKLATAPNDWRLGEVATNIFLFSCGLLNCIEERLLGTTLRLPKRLAATAVGRGARRLVEAVADKPLTRRRLARWRKQLLADLNDFLSLMVGRQTLDAARLVESGHRLKTVLETTLPADLQAQRLGTPIPFRRLDLTQNDCLSLAEAFVHRFPDRAQPLLVLGLRTAGTYFAPLLRAYFEANGYRNVALMTVEPNKGAGRRENNELQEFAKRGYWALIVDDAPSSSGTVLTAFDITQHAGFTSGNVKFLVPTHPAKPNWFKPLPESSVVTLLPDQWYKKRLLDPKVAKDRLTEYFRGRNYTRVSVIESTATEKFDAYLHGTASDDRGIRLKRIFEVELEAPDGQKQTKYVLAKSVGWGWLGYHAFLAGYRLSEYVPPLLGLRDGILYMEWLPQAQAQPVIDRDELIDTAASYVAARVDRLKLPGSAAGMDLKKHDNGSRLLAQALSRAYGRFPADRLMQSRLAKLVRKQRCPSPTFIDGNMHVSEWILGPRGPLKTDYEHHGMGRSVLNVVDPAYDLADAILNLSLSSDEERRLIKQYIAASGDAAVEQRLFMHKLLAGLWAMSQAQDKFFDSQRGSKAKHDYHRRFMNAWNFLTVQSARYCGSFYQPQAAQRWHAPLVVLDIDGVLDRRMFGFPCPSAAGIEALSLLNAHGLSVALNSARSVGEMKDYCEAYGLAGGVAEYGSYLWDAVGRRERVLISPEAQKQLAKLRGHLQRVPGVFLDERHRYSIKAFTYRNKPQGVMHALVGSARVSSIGDGAMVPLSTHIVHQLLEDLELDRLTFRHTGLDTAIVAKEADKGTGLIALQDWVLTPDAETIAVGDDEPDLAMFRVATRSFAPANIGCRNQARLHGCKIVPHSFQRGLLDIVRGIVHPDGNQCEHCRRAETAAHRTDDLILAALQAADQSWSTNLRKALRDPAAIKMLLQ